MSNSENRRDFLKLSLATGCVAAVSTPALADTTAEASSDCDTRIRQAQRDQRDREMRETVTLLGKIRDKLGDDVVKITAKHTSDKIEDRFKNRELAARDLSAVKSLLWDNLPQDRFTVEKIEDSDERLEFRVTRCQIADTLKDLNQPGLAYALNCAWDEGFCKGLNPNMQFIRTKTLINGDEYCNHTYVLKKAEEKS